MRYRDLSTRTLGGVTMRHMLLITAMLASPLALGSVGEAQDRQTGAPVTGAGGLRTYEGTFDAGAGVSGSIKLFADFATRTMRADLTIPSLPSDGVMMPPNHFTPSGAILANKDGPPSYSLTQGAAYSPEPQGARRTQKHQSGSSYILLTGSFWGPGSDALDTSGSFAANFCVPETQCKEVSSVAGTYSATALK
jgi:hypothetical protein